MNLESVIRGGTGQALRTEAERLKAALEINVVFTTIQGTLAAVEKAGQLAEQLGARIRILIPRVVPYVLPLECPAVNPELIARRLRTRCPHGSVATRIDVQLCRDARQCLKRALKPESIVVIGGPKRWWPTKESRLATEMKRSGYSVVFVPQNRGKL